MGKKKTVNLNGEPLRDAPFTEGVQITYKHNTIAQSADTVEYALETGGKAVEADIGVVYVKPEPETVTIPIYYQTNNAGVYSDETLFDTMTGQAGELYSHYGNVIVENATSATLSWVGENLYQSITSMVFEFDSRESMLTITTYIPNEIPEGYNRIVCMINVRN